jgi:hypothetical protein
MTAMTPRRQATGAATATTQEVRAARPWLRQTGFFLLSVALTAIVLVLSVRISGIPFSLGANSDKGPVTMPDVLAMAGCTDSKQGDVQIYTKEAATCTKDGHDLHLYTFADDAARDSWLKMVTDTGGPGSMVFGTSWVIQTVSGPGSGRNE